MTQHNFSEHADAVSPDLNPEPAPDPIKEPAPTLPVNDPPKDEPTRGEPPVGDPPVKEPPPEETQESFADLLNAFEKSHSHKSAPGAAQLQGTVVSLSADQIFLDIGYKTEGVLARSAFPNHAEGVKAGDTFTVSVTGRNEEHYYELSRFKVTQVRDWTALEAAFQEKLAVVGTVTAVVKGGLSVDVGVRAFMPASRSGTRDAIELEKLVGTEITCRITKLDVTDEDVVVDRRVVLEEQARALTQASRDDLQASIKEGDIVTGTVRTLMPYGAFVDLGGIDGLLHVSDMAHSRVSKPDDVLTVGQQIEVKVLKIDPATQKISLGLKQLQPAPWANAGARLIAGQRVTGKVTRIMDFGAFVEIEPGIEGLIHISEMAWGKKVRHPSDILKQGDTVDAVILSVKPEERRIALGLKQTLTDPWSNAQQQYPIGSQVEGPVTKLMNFGAFVQLVDGIEGLIHVSEISAAKRINHPSDVLRTGQVVKAQVLAIDVEKRQIKLSMKQLIPTSIDEYIAEHKVGDQVSGRVVELSPTQVIVELGEGIRGTCGTCGAAGTGRAGGAPTAPSIAPETDAAPKVDLSNISSMLKDRWKGNTPAAAVKPEPLSVGQIRTFKVVKLDAESKKIEVELG